MGNSWIEGNFQYKNADEIISTLVYASFDKVVESKFLLQSCVSMVADSHCLANRS